LRRKRNVEVTIYDLVLQRRHLLLDASEPEYVPPTSEIGGDVFEVVRAAGEVLTRTVAVVETEAEGVGANVTEPTIGRHHFAYQAPSEALGYLRPEAGAVNAVVAQQSLRGLRVADREHP